MSDAESAGDRHVAWTADDPGVTRLNIDHYRRLLKRDLDDAGRARARALLAKAEAREAGNQAKAQAARDALARG